MRAAPRQGTSFENPSRFQTIIPVRCNVLDPIDAPNGLRPPDFQPVQLHRISESEQLARIVRGEIAAARSLQSRSFAPTRGPGDDRARGRSFELQAHPMIARAGVMQ